ncbi:MAG: ribosome maturation factor RimM [Oscillospiraceae bacterium]|nr:ribosome maturation factor RimM [Oscillospiraceae bacterium]
MTDLLEAGKIVNTHGVRGAVKIEPWTDTPDFLRRLPRVFIDGAEYGMLDAAVHKNHVIATLEGVTTYADANALRGRTLFFSRSDIPLDEGVSFVADVIGLDAVDDATGERIGVIEDFISLPAHGVYVVRGELERLIPAVPEFVVKIDTDGGAVRFRLIEGL